jgi:hypothetical protein
LAFAPPDPAPEHALPRHANRRPLGPQCPAIQAAQVPGNPPHSPPEATAVPRCPGVFGCKKKRFIEKEDPRAPQAEDPALLGSYGARRLGSPRLGPLSRPGSLPPAICSTIPRPPRASRTLLRTSAAPSSFQSPGVVPLTLLASASRVEAVSRRPSIASKAWFALAEFSL